ncbi:MAG: host-nuclease inhibitor Gam family protein [Syntrophobacteraceae bacterium]
MSISVTTWLDVENALEQIGLLDLESSEVTSTLGRKLYDVLGEHSKRLNELAAERACLETAIQSFCLQNKSEFAKKRSRQMQFGRIAFRVAERIEIPDSLQAAVIATLKKFGFTDCIEIKERLDRAALKKLSDTDLARCGVKRVREDHFRIAPDLALISEQVGQKLSEPEFAIDLEKLSRMVTKKEADKSEEAKS